MEHRSILLDRCDRISAVDVVATFPSIIIFLVSSLIVPLEWHKIWVDIEHFKFSLFQICQEGVTLTNPNLSQ